MPQITQEQLKVLMSDLSPARVSSRKQGGASLSYLEAYDVKATLIRVFGFGGFNAEVIDSQVLEINRDTDATDSKGNQYTKIVALAKCTVRLYIKDLDAVYTETAAASQTGRDVGEVVDFALKTAESDALKRAAIYLGTQFGLSLYNNGSTSEVVRRVFAPGQEWPSAEAQKMSAETEQALKESLGAQEVTQ